MRTEVLRAGRREDMERAAALLRGGRIVAFPTETVYGLGARADDAAAVAELQRLKRRPKEKRFALLIASPGDALRCGAPGPAALALARVLWPGPLTLVIPDGKGGDVGLRCPDCEPTLELLRLVGTPLAAPSANLSGEPPAATAEQVLQVFDGRIAAVLDGGPSRLTVPSTVVRVLGAEVEVLREGAIPETQIREALSRLD
ncbi:MAG: threonylcarbamoyl-AMP synthase [Candidatus Brocadiae bacterium]|nr:threonylcarbamoyl-AMP synthase [Candidatus Brocadiia bacterium]